MSTTRSSFVKAMVKDGYPYSWDAYEKQKVVFDQLFDTMTSDAAYEQFTSAVGPGKLTETTEGTTIAQNPLQEGFVVYCKNKKYTESFKATYELIDDNQKIKNMFNDWSRMMGETTALTLESEHAAIFNKGGFTSGHAAFDNSIAGVLTPSYGNFIYDGKPFFALSGNNHTAKNNSTYYNSLGTKTLGGSLLEEMSKLISVTNAYSEAGNEVSIIPDVLLVQLNSANYWTAKRLLESTGDVDATHSGVSNIWRNGLQLIGWRFIDTANAVYLGCSKKGLKSLSRMPLTFDTWDDKGIQAHVISGTVRGGRCVTNFRYWAAANLSTS